MKKLIQTPEVIKDLMISVFKSVFPEVKELKSFPVLQKISKEQDAWIWLLPNGKCLYYFGTEFKILNIQPKEFEILRNEQTGKIPDSCQYKAYPAQYTSSTDTEQRTGVILELIFGCARSNHLLQWYDKGLVFDVVDEEQIKPVSSEHRFLIEQLLELRDTELAEKRKTI